MGAVQVTALHTTDVNISNSKVFTAVLVQKDVFEVLGNSYNC